MKGEILKTQLLKIEPTLVEVANKLGISKQTLDSRLSAADIKTGFVEQLATLYERPVSYFFGESIKVEDHSRKDDHSSFFGDTEHYEGADTMAMAKIQAAEEKIKFLETLLKDRDVLLSEKDARISELQKMNEYLMKSK